MKSPGQLWPARGRLKPRRLPMCTTWPHADYLIWAAEYRGIVAGNAEPKKILNSKESYWLMAKNTITFDTVREIGLALAGVEESTAYGSPALKVHGNVMASMAINRSSEHGSLGVWVDFDDRAEPLAADPDVY